MRPTIRDVARKLHLSITTVSRALDGYEDVAEETRERVIEAASLIGYAPNRAARQLRRQKADTVGFIIPALSKRFSEPFFTEFISGMGEELSSQNYDLLVSNARTDEQERELYRRWISGNKVDGFVLNGICSHDWRVEYLSKSDIPFVALGKSLDGVDYPYIRITGAKAYLDLVRHIREKGFARFAFIGGPGEIMNHVERLRWFKLALEKCGLPLQPEHLLATDMTSMGGYEAAKRLLSLPQPPDALLCVNDETAFGALHAAHEHGLEIGTQLAIAGFDGIRESKYTEPPLTTLDIPVHDIARKLIDMLLRTLSNRPGESVARIKPILIIRESTGG
ncbi:MAG: LacI family DNA-binding transcriptional regulator [Bacteroidota bacterium]